MSNQNPEQVARDNIDTQLKAAGWAVQNKDTFDFNQSQGQAIREFSTDTGPADYVLFIDKKPVGVIEAKKDTHGHNITTVEDQTGEYAAAKLKWVQKTGGPLPFLYEATGVITRFTDQRDPKPRSREVFSFHRPETLREWLTQPESLRARLTQLPALDPTGLRDCQITAITSLEKSYAKARPRRRARRSRPRAHPQSHGAFAIRIRPPAQCQRPHPPQVGATNLPPKRSRPDPATPRRIESSERPQGTCRIKGKAPITMKP